jgi:predicted enzyme related to lactoylglutathione lyase
MSHPVVSHPVVHWEIGGQDAPALREFYSKAFGWQMIDAGPEYTLVHATGDGFGGGIMQAREGVPSYATIYVAVDDLQAQLSAIESLGGKTIVPPTTISPTASFALFADPEGTVIGLLKQTEPVA